MKTADKTAGSAGNAEQSRRNGPMPFSPGTDDLPSGNGDRPIEPPPRANRRTFKAKLTHRGPSQPIPITDPWE